MRPVNGAGRVELLLSSRLRVARESRPALGLLGSRRAESVLPSGYKPEEAVRMYLLSNLSATASEQF